MADPMPESEVKAPEAPAPEKAEAEEEEEEEERPDRPVRDRKQPVRLQTDDTPSSSAAALVIPEGKGTKLSDIPNVQKMIARCHPADADVRLCHKVCFKNMGSEKTRKANLRRFSGCVEPEEQVRHRVELLDTITNLKAVAQMFDCVPVGKDKEAIVDAIVAFLMKPAASGKPLVTKAPTAKKASTPKKSQAKSKSKSKSKASGKKEKPSGPKRPMSSYFYFVQEQRPRVQHKYPQMTTVDIAKKISERWKRLEESDKKPYEKQAAKDKERYEKEKKEWRKQTKETENGTKRKRKEESDAEDAEDGSESEDNATADATHAAKKQKGAVKEEKAAKHSETTGEAPPPEKAPTKENADEVKEDGEAKQQ